MDLSGTWTLASVDGTHHTSMQVPGDVHSALIAAEIIPHPYKGRNEYDVRWVAEGEWTLERSFDWDGPDGSWYLDIDYLDTVAEVFLNGKSVLKAANCFRRYLPDVSKHLRRGRNSLVIHFASNIAEAAKRQAEQPFYVPYALQNCPIPHGNMLRKPACHFGWDWNLAIAPFGLYGRIELKRASSVRIESIQVNQTHNADGSVDLEVEVWLSGFDDTKVLYSISFDGVTNEIVEDNSATHQWHSERFHIAKPKLWWPAGLGEQHLYELVVRCGDQVETRRIGLRKIELIAEKDDVGRNFKFRVNGVGIFCKGANWIPADALPQAATREITEKLLRAAADANMNMIRVWGGGYYEQDFFYDLCDELGLLVWQDFMFACNLYPSTPEFLAEVEAEVDYQVRRLGHHACLALWCGDNELIGALTWFEESRKDRDRYLVSYDRLNRTIEEAMRGADETANWWPSSPSPGPLSFGDAWHDDRSGDMHFWSVWHEGRNFEHYRDVQPRFCSEFGFQSFPSLRIARELADGEELNISSPVMESHQKNAGGNARIAETMFRYFRFPMDFGNFCYLSQIQQGLAIKTAVDYWRSLKPHCMGTLYWQLNDTWPVASWSGLDHGGTWKALHYMAQRFYAPVTVVAYPDKETGVILFKGVNDTANDVTILADVLSLSPEGGTTTLGALQCITTPTTASELGKIEAAKLRDSEILVFSWKASNGATGRDQLAVKPYKTLKLQPPQLAVNASLKGKNLEIRMTVERPALYVMAETNVAGRFSGNVFDLLPGETVTLTFTPDNPQDLSRAAASLMVRDLYSSSATGT